MIALWAALSQASPTEAATPPGQRGVWLAAAGWFQPPTRAQEAGVFPAEVRVFEVGRAQGGVRLRPNEGTQQAGVVRWEVAALAEFTPVVGHLVAGGTRIPLAVHALVGSAAVATELGVSHLLWVERSDATTLSVERRWRPTLGLAQAPFGSRR